MSQVYELRDWAIILDGRNFSRYSPPEAMRWRLHGSVYGNPNFDDGARITTSIITSTDKRIVTTKRSIYKLAGPPIDEYLHALTKLGYIYDEENPTKALRDEKAL